MKNSEKGRGLVIIVSLAFLILFLALPLTSAVQIVQVEKPAEPQTKNPFSSFGAFFKSSIFWGLVIILVLVIVFGFIAFAIVKWAINFIKLQDDIFYKVRKEKIKLASAQKRLPIRAWLKYRKNIPIRLARNENGKLVLSQPICYYRGDYISHEGNLFISFNMKGNEYLWFFPRTELLIIPNKKEIAIKVKNAEGKTEERKIQNIPTADDIVQFNQNEIILFAEGISNTGYFYLPVLKSKNGKIMDLSIPIYESLKEIAIGNYLFEQTDAFVKVSKKGVELNPTLQYQIKAEPNSNVEVPPKSS